MIDRLDRANLQWELVRLADLIEREAESIRVLTDRGIAVSPCEALRDTIWSLRAAADELGSRKLFVHPVFGD